MRKHRSRSAQMCSTGWLDSNKDLFTSPSVNSDLPGVAITEEAATLPGTAGLYGRSSHAGGVSYE